MMVKINVINNALGLLYFLFQEQCAPKPIPYFAENMIPISTAGKLKLVTVKSDGLS